VTLVSISVVEKGASKTSLRWVLKCDVFSISTWLPSGYIFTVFTPSIAA
jgi:hypothetical protein